MTIRIPDDILRAFSTAQSRIAKAAWHDADWSCCSGLWQPEQYGDTVVIALARRNWVTTFPITLTSRAEIQYAAWVDRKLAAKATLRFELHLFALATPGRKVKKGDLTRAFRAKASARIDGFGHHDVERGPAVPYAGGYVYADVEDLTRFIVRDFQDFAGIAPLLDQCLTDFAVDQSSLGGPESPPRARTGNG